MTVVLRLAGLAVLALLFAPAAAGQSSTVTSSASGSSDECSQESPCLLNIIVNATGFYAVHDVFFEEAGHPDEVVFTQGDWYSVYLESDDEERSHTVTLSEHDVEVTVEPFGYTGEELAPFEFSKTGTFTLRDDPSGDTFNVRVVNEDEDGFGSDTTSSEGRGSPALPIALVAVALLVLAGRRRA